MAYEIEATRNGQDLVLSAEGKDAYRMVCDLMEEGVQIDTISLVGEGGAEKHFYLEAHRWAFDHATTGKGFIDFGEGEYMTGKELNAWQKEEGMEPSYKEDLIYWTEDGTLSGYINETGYRTFDDVLREYFGIEG